MQSRSQQYRVAGIGAVFTPESCRGHSYAAEMLKELIEHCRIAGYDALLLYSDIDVAYYEKLGFHRLDDSNFYLEADRATLGASLERLDWLSGSVSSDAIDLRTLSLGDCQTMSRHYNRVLGQKSYGVKRSYMYWQYKVFRELYLFQNSNLTYPKMELLSLNFGCSDGAYALFEQGGSTLRVLEVVGGHSQRLLLWAGILRLSQNRKISLIRGWQSAAPDDIKEWQSYTRSWARPMLFPLNKRLEPWLEEDSCPLYELDHL